MKETEKGARSDIKPGAPLPWVRELDDVRVPQYAPRRCRVIRSVGGPVVAYDIGVPEADYIVHACNSHPKLVELATEKDAEIARLRERAALLESLLAESLRHGYVDLEKCSPTWLREATEATKR